MAMIYALNPRMRGDI